MTMQYRQVGPGMVQQIQQMCGDCKGAGETIPAKDRCKKCKGEKTVTESKQLDVFIEPGMENGQRITFAGEGDQAPDVTPGDVIIELEEKPHDTFKRKGGDLVMTQTLPLVTALCGGEFAIKHLDGHDLLVRIAPGEVIRPGDFRIIYNKGMPYYKRSIDKGNLIISFDIEMPPANWLADDKLKQLAALLPPAKKANYNDDDVDEVNMQAFNIDNYQHSNSRGSGA